MAELATAGPGWRWPGRCRPIPARRGQRVRDSVQGSFPVASIVVAAGRGGASGRGEPGSDRGERVRPAAAGLPYAAAMAEIGCRRQSGLAGPAARQRQPIQSRSRRSGPRAGPIPSARATGPALPERAPDLDRSLGPAPGPSRAGLGARSGEWPGHSKRPGCGLRGRRPRHDPGPSPVRRGGALGPAAQPARPTGPDEALPRPAATRRPKYGLQGGCPVDPFCKAGSGRGDRLLSQAAATCRATGYPVEAGRQ